ncbi:MAG: helix-turn-helix transcriptional regulator [Tenericutes bacterium]|nr:helix-turn-helix transcriptional regulator [Mycoplasmatota bacterium]
MSLGSKFIKYRKDLKMSQEGVAEVLNVTRQTISNWELDLTSPDLEQTKKICKLYKIDFYAILYK